MICTSDGALPADNCVPTTALEKCADKWVCVKVGNNVCGPGDFLGNVYHNIVVEGGDCRLPE